jgi:phosphomannomutase
MAIKFGTDGWRAVIAEDYTFENVRYCAQGTSAYLKEQNLAPHGLVVGYDTRFASEDFAAAVAEVSAGNGVPTFLCDKAAPTPVVTYNMVALNAGGGAVITASHNPGKWNGFKYKPDYGGSASQEIVDQLEVHIGRVEASGAFNRIPLQDAIARGLVEYVDPEPPYLSHIASLVDLSGIRNAGLKIVVDSMYGSGAGYIAKLLSGGSTEVIELHGIRNPAFPGFAQPEPIAHNLGELMSAVPSMGAHVGIALDGDADRVGIVDEEGQFMTTLQTFALLCLHELEILENTGPLVRSITMTSMINKLGELYNVPVFETPVGFKYLGPVMRQREALMAGEESGGYAFRENIPERDGILSGLMILDMMVKTGKTPTELLQMLYDKVGPHHYERWDLEFEEEERETIKANLMAARPSSIGGRRVEAIDTQDGFRYVLEGGYWSLVRFSGTEPLLRVYAEGESADEVTDLLDETREMAGV